MINRNINLSQFLSSRSGELQFLQQNLQQKFPNKTQAQQLPKHMRRRAMSHNRIPSRVRQISDFEQQKNQAKIFKRGVCRKHIRKPNQLLCSYQRRSKKCKWLETHLWHSKRMKMIDYYGFKISEKNNDKGQRACYRFQKNDSVLHDLSYYQIIIVKSNSLINLQNLLGIYTKNHNFQNLRYIQGNIYSTTNFYLNDQFLVQFDYFFINNNEIMLIVHPSSYQMVYLALLNNQNQVIVQLIENQINIFHLSGPKCLLRMDQLLQKVGVVKNDIQQYFQIIHDPQQYPRGQIFNLQIQIKNEKKIIKLPDLIQNHQQDQKQEQQKIQKQIEQLLMISQIQRGNDNFNIWKNIIEEKQDENNIKFQIISRSRYTHRKKPQNFFKKNETNQKIEQIEQKIYQKIEQQTEQKIELEQILPSDQKQIDIIIIFDNKRQFNQGIRIFVQQNKGIQIFRQLSLLNCKIVGLKEFQFNQFLSNQPIFPNDFPESSIYQKHIQIQKLMNKYFKKPVQKRINYIKIQSPYPFFNMQLQKDVIKVCIEMLGRGIPKNQSYICLCQQEDIQQLFKNTKFQSVYTEQLQENIEAQKQLKLLTQNEYLDNLNQVQTQRQIIGFVTTGDFSFVKQKGIGFGYIFANYDEMFKQEKENYFLIRNYNSINYFFAQCKKI